MTGRGTIHQLTDAMETNTKDVIMNIPEVMFSTNICFRTRIDVKSLVIMVYHQFQLLMFQDLSSCYLASPPKKRFLLFIQNTSLFTTLITHYLIIFTWDSGRKKCYIYVFKCMVPVRSVACARNHTKQIVS